MLSLRGLLRGVVVGGWCRGVWRGLWTAQCRGDELVLSEDGGGGGSGGRSLRLPHPWLRDNCQCPVCFHAPSQSRIIDIQRFDFYAKPVKYNVIGGEWLDVIWSDGHESRYGMAWLSAREFRPRPHDLVPDPQPWTADQFPSIMRRFTYTDVLDKDDALLGWLESLAIRGVAIIEGAGRDKGKLQLLADRVAFLKRTYYGETFSVRTKPGTSNVAYLSGSLQLHTDLPYYGYKPGINLLHCLEQGEGSEGGESELSDGLGACEWMAATHPRHRWLLATVPVQWEDVVREEGGRTYHAVHRAPVICESACGEVERVNWSQPQRGSVFAAPLDRCVAWYRAVEVFARRVHSDRCKVRYRMRPGEILTFDNLRVLHGRTTYEGERELEGGYVDWDHARSKIRVLRRQLHGGDPPPPPATK